MWLPNSIRSSLPTSSLGHSASLVSVEIAGEVYTEGLTEWLPEAPEGERMRIPYPGRLKELEERHRLFERSGSKIHRPTAGRSTLYATPQANISEPTQGVFDRMIILKRVTGPEGWAGFDAVANGGAARRDPQEIRAAATGVHQRARSSQHA